MTGHGTIRAELLRHVLGCVLLILVGAMTTVWFSAAAEIANAQPVNWKDRHLDSSATNIAVAVNDRSSGVLPQHEPLRVLQIVSRSPRAPQFNIPPITQLPLPLPTSTYGQQALSVAESEFGAPYTWGDPRSFDSSGLAHWAYLQTCMSIPQTTYDQALGGAPVSRQDLAPGELVLFYGGEHLGLHTGSSEVIYAPTSAQSVKRASLDALLPRSSVLTRRLLFEELSGTWQS